MESNVNAVRCGEQESHNKGVGVRATINAQNNSISTFCCRPQTTKYIKLLFACHRNITTVKKLCVSGSMHLRWLNIWPTSTVADAPRMKYESTPETANSLGWMGDKSFILLRLYWIYAKFLAQSSQFIKKYILTKWFEFECFLCFYIVYFL